MAFTLYLASLDDLKITPYAYDHAWPLLYSQLYNRCAIKYRLEAGREGRGGKLFIDSGAHSAHTKGSEVNVDEYIDYINERIDDVTVYAQVDKIPGRYRQEKTAQDFLDAPKLSWENYLYMHEKSADPDKLMPVFHQGEDLKWLENMCNYTFPDGSKVQYIGLSPRGDVTLRQKYDFSAECFGIIQSSNNPNVKVHALGATSLGMLERLPYYSADSTTWVLVSAYGQVWVPSDLFSDIITDDFTTGVKLGVSLENKVHPTNKEVYWFQNEATRKRLDDYFESIGTNLEELSTSHSRRAWASAIFTQNWAKNYQYKGLKSFVKPKLLF